MRKLLTAIVALVCFSAANAEIVAGIELGSKGIKAIAIDYKGLDRDGQQSYKIVFREDIRADVIDGAKDGLLLESKIGEAVNAVSTLFTRLKQFDPQYFVIVGSTSFDNYKNAPALGTAIFEKINHKVAYITSDEEIFYALKASVRKKFLSRSILIDIGSGNTKIGYATPMNPKGFESTRFEYGTKSLAEKAIKAGGDFPEAVRQIIRSEIVPAVRSAIQKQPGIASVHRRIYIEGGASWAVATYAQPENVDKPFTYLNSKDIDTVTKRFESNDLKIVNMPQKAEDTFIKISDNFDAKQLHAGANILRTLMTEINASQRTIVFNRDGGWILGYIIANYNEQKGVTE
jgi:exopolyphosphatase/pppGpp-phosphohydrolase